LRAFVHIRAVNLGRGLTLLVMIAFWVVWLLLLQIHSIAPFLFYYYHINAVIIVIAVMMAHTNDTSVIIFNP
jgi:hypothetical protein